VPGLKQRQEAIVRTLLAIAILAGAVLAPHTPADSADAKKRSVKPRDHTRSTRVYSREEVECERARHEDPTGLYADYPCWAREALAKGKNQNEQ
jgi:hypothetical protein